MDIKKNIRIIRQSRSLFDKAIIRLLPGVFSRFVNRHLARAQEFGGINNHQLHELDAQFKGDLERPGFQHLTS
jgi:hypothetical protein